MGWAERKNPMSWRNRTAEQRAEGVREKARREAARILRRAHIRKLIAEYRKRRAAAQGVAGE